MEVLSKAPPVQTATIKKTAYRIDSIDLLRGLVMIIMALDHTRDFFHAQAFTDDPLNLNTTTPWLFFTRWITHFCAPVFVFLAGSSAYFQSLRKSKKELSLFLIKRGLWLILIEIVVMSFAFSFDVHYSLIFFQTIWSIGISMVFLGLAIWMPYTAILTIGLVIVFGHNLLDFAEKNHQGPYPFLWEITHRQAFYHLWDNHNLMVLYPFLPWTGLMLMGYCFGKLFHSLQAGQRTRVLTILSGALVLLFVLLRAANVYGDPDPWSVQKNTLYSFFSFINVHKYPPSLLFMCATIGPALLFLAWVGHAGSRLARAITVYGRVPFFYYILHFYILHTICVVLFLIRGHSFSEGLKGAPGSPFKFIIPGEGYNLWVVYLIWLLVVIGLYPLCKWFSDYKKAHKQWWLSYF
jgi:uncharacterized membrane protein